MTSVDFGLMSSAPVAITAAGLLVVLPPDTTLDAVVCCTVNLDRLDTRYDTGSVLHSHHTTISTSFYYLQEVKFVLIEFITRHDSIISLVTQYCIRPVMIDLPET